MPSGRFGLCMKGDRQVDRAKKNGKAPGQFDLKNLDPEEKMKYEIAEELGLLDRVMENGWKSLSSKETGRIGGMIAGKKREVRKRGESLETDGK